MLLGFFTAKLTMQGKIEDKQVVEFLRKKQRARIIRAITKKF